MFQDVPFLQGLTGQTLPYFLFIGIVNTALGYVFHMLAIEKTSAIHGSLVFFFKPILAPLFALAVLGEAVTPPILLGIVCFLAGSLVSILPRHPSGTKGRARPPGRGGRPTTRRKRKVESLCSLPPLICPPGPAGNTFIITATSCLRLLRDSAAGCDPVSGHAGAEGAEILPQFHLVRVPYNPLPPRLSDGRGQ